ncbi:MAG: hypothetical protein Q7S40_24430 [Opitutaceae bacterium]|nr:hypothetical protein [Opitutaceae bacterium]
MNKTLVHQPVQRHGGAFTVRQHWFAIGSVEDGGTMELSFTGDTDDLNPAGKDRATASRRRNA